MTRLVSLLLFCGFQNTWSEKIEFKLPSACNELSDGYHYIQPLTESQLKEISESDSVSAPPIKVMCSNGYTIINPTLDPNVINYFSSYHDYHVSFSGPSLDDHVSWDTWWLPAKEDTNLNGDNSDDDENDDEMDEDNKIEMQRRRILETTPVSNADTAEKDGSDDPWDNAELQETVTKWSVSEDCNSCLGEDSLEYSTTTTYYMTGDNYGCNWYTKFICDFDIDTLECYTCSSKTSLASQSYSGKCGHMALPSYMRSHNNHKYCTEANGEYLPSIGTVNKYCVCYKPSTWDYVESSENYELVDIETVESEGKAAIDEDTSRVIYLNQNDFKSGTYRITRPGTYILEEDIVFDFNAGDIDSPNDAHSWMPKDSQSSDYPGAGEDEWDGPFWLGFFAGITIETSNVVLDLAGHEIGMSHAFYLQQRVFSCIELNNKMFRDGEGPTWMGTGLSKVDNVVISNGVIGLTSHLGIHGNTIYSLTLRDLHIKDFETHGVTINEFYSLSIYDTEIGPSVNGQLGLNGMYTLARTALPIFRDAAKNYPDSVVALGGHRPTPINSLVHILVEQMDLAFAYAYKGEHPVEGDDDYDTWLAAKDLFVNDWGIPRAGVVYGALLRSRGASVFGYGKDSGGHSKNLKMKNVEIHDLSLSMDEIVSIGNNRHRWIKDMFNGPVPFKSATDNKLSDLGEAKYIGNAWTDLIVALRLVDDSWWHLGRITLWSEFITWAQSGEMTLKEALGGDVNEAVFGHCNNDYLGHVPKGVLGLRLENIDNVQLDNVEIHDLMASSPLGSDECGAYTGGDDGGMPLQNSGTNAGYGGTNSRGIYMYELRDVTMNDVYVHHVMSSNGPSYGLYMYETPDVAIKGDTKFEHIHGGLETLSKGEDYSEDRWPNTAARSCAIEMELRSSIKTEDSDDVSVSCMLGHNYCKCSVTDDENAMGMVGESSCYGVIEDVTMCESEASYQLPFHEVKVSPNTKEIELIEKDNGGGYQAISYEEIALVKMNGGKENGLILNQHLGDSHKFFLWVAIIGTTLVSVFLISLYKIRENVKEKYAMKQ